MTLNRLVLHNYMIHRDLTADFSGNLIALTGEMGHGKSTFVGAIQFCLTGEHPPWHREDLVSWGCEEGSAKLYFSHDGLDCSILRKLHSSEVVLKIGTETFTGAKNVEKTMAERLGVDKDILKQIGFVQQYEIQSILFDDPGKRERSFQKLLGIGDANKIWTELGTIIQGYSKTENFDASIESMRQMIAKLNEELSAVDSHLALSSKALSLMPSVDELRAELERLTHLRSNISILSDIRLSIEGADSHIRSTTEHLIRLKASRSEKASMLGCSIEEMDGMVNELRSRRDGKLAELTNMQKLSGASSTDGSCPLCGSHVEPGQIAEHTAAELARLEKEYSDSNKLYDSTVKVFNSIKSEIASIDRSIANGENMIAADTIRIKSEKERELKILQEFAKLGIAPDEADIVKLTGDTDERMFDCKATMDKFTELNMQISVMQGEKNAKMAQLKQANDMLEAKVREKELSEPIARKVETLTKVRNWFHSSNGPRTMSMSAIKSMTGYVNEYLKELHSEITVMPDNNGLSFAFEYVDGRPVSNPPPSTAKLSGGQKICLALAFRLAIYRYFGQKMGIMVLDEPTAHLSPAGIEYFGELLQTVSTLAKNMNLQIIMPTHEKEIMPFMDSEIHFS